jgi:hypothetical protein
MVASTTWALGGLTELFAPMDASKTNVALKVIVGLVIGVPATVVFYYFQHMDEAQRSKKY